MPPSDPAYTERQLADATRREFPLPEFLWMEQVLLESRRVDAVAVSRYASRGQLLYGFEFKTTRADWRRELRNGLKAEEWAAYCDRWYVVTPPGTVHPGELPLRWGLYELHGEKLVQISKALPLEPNTRTWKFCVTLLDSVVSGTVPASTLVEQGNRTYTEAATQARVQVEAEVMTLRAQNQNHLARLQEFVRFLGIQPYLPLERLLPFQALYQALTDFVLRFERTSVPFERILPLITDLLTSAQAFVQKIEATRAELLAAQPPVDHPAAVP